MHSSISEGARTPTKKNSFLELYQMTSYDLAKKKTNWNGGKEVKLFTSALKAFQFNNRIVMAQRKHLDDFLRGRIIGRLKCGRTQLEVSEEHGITQSVISRLWQRFQDDAPRVLLNQFRRSQKLPNDNYVQFASRIEAMFDYYCKLRNVNEFNELRQLIVAHQIINSLDQELTSYVNLKMCENWYKPDKLGRKLDFFMSS
ncbi:transposable element Tcb1 transposase [Trichonephila clavipes]|nr:transposable element Tcb1 transposase [Trichonephila clavipes]